MAGSGRQCRNAAEGRAEPVAERGVEGDGAGPGFLGDGDGTSVGLHGLVDAGRDRGDEVTGLRVGFRPGIEPGVHARGDDVRASGDDLEAANGCPRARGGGGGLVHGDDRAGGRHHRVPAPGHQGGAGVVALAGHGEAPPPVGEDRRGHGHGLAEVDQAAALFDVQFDEESDPAERVPVGAEAFRVEPGAHGRFGERHAVRVDEGPGAVGVDAAGHQPRAEAGDPEPGALLLREDEHRAGPGRGEPGGLQPGDGVERRDDTERAVVGAAAGHGVEVAAGDDGIRAGCSPPGPDVAVAVGLAGETEALGALEEPGPQLEVGLLPEVAGVAAAATGTAGLGDLVEAGQQAVRERRCHSDSHIGTRRPRSLAASSARS